MWLEVQTEQLTVAVCVRPQPQNMEDESRGMTQTCIVRSNERSLRSNRSHVIRACEFLAKFRFLKQPGGTNHNAEEFVTILSARWRLLQKVHLTFWESLFFAKLHVPHDYLPVYLRQLTLSQKALCHALCCPFYSTLDVKLLHIHSCWTLFLAVKNTHLIAAVSSENCNVHT